MPMNRTDFILLVLMLCGAVIGSASVLSMSIHQAAERCVPTEIP